MSVNSKMTALADEIRELSGSTSKKSIDDMTSDVGSANTEVASQTELIAQITTALEGKASNPGGVTLPTLDNPATGSDILSGKEAIDGSGNKITGNIATKTSSNLTASGATVTVPAGYYASNASKSISSGSAKTPATTITKNPTISVSTSGLITASVSGTQSVTPTVTSGYVSSGTAGTITVSGSNTKQLTTQAAKTITPSTSSQTAVASGVYTTGAVTVTGDANLKAENIKSGVSIFGVSGTLTSGSTGEDVTDEVNAYTNKIALLETAVSNLETELAGKASGGSGGNLEPYTVSISYMSASPSSIINIFYNKADGSMASVPLVNVNTTIPDAHGLLAICSTSDVIQPFGGSIDCLWTNGYEVLVYNITTNGTIEIA